jgi:hypothetical protein
LGCCAGDGREDVLVQVTGAELAHAVLATTVPGTRLVWLLQQTAAASALHRATVRATLVDMLPARTGPVARGASVKPV